MRLLGQPGLLDTLRHLRSLSLSLLTSVVDCQTTYVFNESVLISDVPVVFLFETHWAAGPFELHRMFALGWWAGLYRAGHLGI